MAMNLLQRFRNALRVRPEDPNGRGRGDLLAISSSGVRVNPELAFQVSVVWACVDAIAAALSSSDWCVYAGIRGADNTTAVPQDGLHYILNSRFNPEMTAQAGKRCMLIAAVGYGNGYAEIERDMAGRIIALWPISPDRVEVRRNTDTGRLFYRVTQDYAQGTVDMDATDIFHIRGSGIMGHVGDSVVTRAAQAIGEAIALTQFSSAYFGNNTQLGTVFMYKGGRLDDNIYQRIKDQLEKRHRGSRNAHRAAILDGGDWDVKTLGTDANKAMLIEAKQQVIEDVCRYFHVPPHKVQHLLRATNNNIEHQGLEFSRDTLRPWKCEIEQELDYKCIPMRSTKFVIIDLDWAEQGDYKSRAEAFAIYRAQGVFSANDILRKLGENTIGAAGDIRIVQGANVRLEDVGAAYLDEIGAAQDRAAATQQPEDDEEDDDTMEAWLRSVYNRIQRRVSNRTTQVGVERAIADGKAYVPEALADMREVLGGRYERAERWALAVVNGGDPEQACKQFRENARG